MDAIDQDTITDGEIIAYKAWLHSTVLSWRKLHLMADERDVRELWDILERVLSAANDSHHSDNTCTNDTGTTSNENRYPKSRQTLAATRGPLALPSVMLASIITVLLVCVLYVARNVCARRRTSRRTTTGCS